MKSKFLWSLVGALALCVVGFGTITPGQGPSTAWAKLWGYMDNSFEARTNLFKNIAAGNVGKALVVTNESGAVDFQTISGAADPNAITNNETRATSIYGDLTSSNLLASGHVTVAGGFYLPSGSTLTSSNTSFRRRVAIWNDNQQLAPMLSPDISDAELATLDGLTGPILNSLNEKQTQNAIFDNMIGTGIAPGATNASATVSSSSGKATNLTEYGASVVDGTQTVNGKQTNNADIYVKDRITIDGTNSNAGLTASSYSNTAPSILLQKYRGTVAAPTAVLAGDDLGSIQFLARGPTFLRFPAAFYAEALNDFSGTDASSRLKLTIGNQSAGAGALVASWSSTIYSNNLNAFFKSNMVIGGSLTITDQVYGAGWDGDLTVPTKNALYDKIEAISAGGISDGDKGQIVVSGSGSVWTIDANVVDNGKIVDDTILPAKIADADWGAFTISGNSAALDNNVVSYANLQDITATHRVLGRNTAAAGDTEEVIASDFLDWLGSTRGSILFKGANGWTNLAPGTSGYVLTSQGSGVDPVYALPSLSNGDKGDVTIASSGASITVDNDAVTYAKMQNISAGQKVLGRNSGAGDPEELDLSTMLDWTTTASGSILYRSASGWTHLFPGTYGQHLVTLGSTGIGPVWEDSGVSLVSQYTQGDDTGGNVIGTNASRTFLASSFVPTTSFSVKRATVRLKKTGSPSFTLDARFYSDSANTPNGFIGVQSYTALDSSTLTTSYADYTFDFATPIAVTSGTKYWLTLVVGGVMGSAANYVTWAGQDPGTGAQFIGNATPTWTVVDSSIAGTMTLYALGVGNVSATTAFGTDNLVAVSDGTGKNVKASSVSISTNGTISAASVTTGTNGSAAGYLALKGTNGNSGVTFTVPDGITGSPTNILKFDLSAPMSVGQVLKVHSISDQTVIITNATDATGGGSSDTANVTVTNKFRVGVTNIIVATPDDTILDLASWTSFNVLLLTNGNFVFSNSAPGILRANVLLQQDTNGQRVTTFRNAGGLLQTNANMQVTTNANALDLLEVASAYYSSNLLAFWPQNFQPRAPATNSLASGGGGGGGATYLIDQTFEGTGYANGESWTENSTVDEDYTTTVIVGSQSCAVSGVFGYTYTTFTGQSDVWAFCRLRFSSGINSSATFRHFLSIRASDDTVLASLKLGDSSGGAASTAHVRIEANGSESADSSVDFALNTSYYVWLHFASGGTCTLHVSTSSTKPGSDGGGNVFLSKTGASGTAARIRLENADGLPIYDHVLVDDATIGDNP